MEHKESRVSVRTWFAATVKTVWGVYLVLTSLYCVLAFLPYTYYALIKSPAYAWMPWFAGHHAVLLWALVSLLAVAAWPPQNKVGFAALVACLFAVGCFISVRHFLPNLENNAAAYWGSLAALWLLIGIVAATHKGRDAAPQIQRDALHLPYAGALIVSVAVSLFYAAAAKFHAYSETHIARVERGDVLLLAWSVLSHLSIAVLAVSVLNLLRTAAARTAHPERVGRVLLAALSLSLLWAVILRFLQNALSFSGWPAHLYAASLAMALTALGFSLFAPIVSVHSKAEQGADARARNAIFLLVVLLLSVGALALSTSIGGGDWNGFYQTSLTLFLWLMLAVAMYRLDQRRADYSMATVAGLLLLSVVSYKAAKLADLSWSSGLGATDDEIAHALDNYGERDASFALARQILDRPQTEPCGDLCRIMREYTNVRDARVNRDLKLIDPLVPAGGSKPNIFVVVIDSLRPDYLGAYNAKADFSPNIDAFAKDSIVVHNAYTEYAGTSLSEPAIWTGALLLHAHYMQPFAKINSLEKLLKTDGYRMVVSNDEILDEVLQASPELTKIDADKKLWNSLELCTTVPQALHVLDARGGSAPPMFFYTQPKNVHQFARNDNPKMTEANWRARPGFSNRVAYEVQQVDACLGTFLKELKKRNLYDNSIVIVTSDHGDATGELGRSSHSLWLYPEVMRVPLIVHLPAAMRKKIVYDDTRVSTLTDITPSLYYLLGHKPVARNAIFGHPLFVESPEELRQYARDEIFMASDVRAAFGILADNGRYFYATYDSPPQSFLFDLASDPTGERNVLNAELKKEYDRRIIEHLQVVADFYGYKPGIGSLLTTSR